MTVKELKTALSYCMDDDAEVKFLNNSGDLKTIEKAFDVDPLDEVSDSYILLV